MSPGDWVNRLSDSIRDHETERRKATSIHPRYRILEEIGRGGMGVVYRALDPQLGREVALKVLLDGDFSNAETRERFLREAQLAARVSHPNIVPVYDSGEHEGHVYLAMQFVEGRGLDRARLDVRPAVTALRDAARAVHHAHLQGIIHRDLKPSNLMVDREGRVYVMDFGLAKQVRPGATLTLSGTIVGTPAYMPPEQARGQATDARSDVYALGATLYEVLTGTAPFTGASPFETVKAVTMDEPVPPRRHNPQISKGLEAVVIKAMDKKPEGRYATAEDFAADLQRWLDGEEVLAPVRGTLYRARKKLVRHRWRVISAVSSIALVAALVYLVLKPPPDPRIEQGHERTRQGDLLGARRLLAGLRVDGVTGRPVALLEDAISQKLAQVLEEKLHAAAFQIVEARFEEASQVFATMKNLDERHVHTLAARSLLEEATKAHARFKELEERTEGYLERDEYRAASKALEEMRTIRLPRLAPLAQGQENIKQITEAWTRLKARLVDKLVKGTGTWIRSTDSLSEAPVLLRPLDRGYYDLLLGQMSPLQRRRLEAADDSLDAAKILEILLKMEEEDRSSPLTTEVTRAYLDLLDRERKDLSAARRMDLALQDAAQAFDPRTTGRLSKIHERALSLGDPRHKLIESALQWLTQFVQVKGQADAPLDAIVGLSGLDALPLADEFKPRASALRKELEVVLADARRRQGIERFLQACRGGRLDEARELRGRLKPLEPGLEKKLQGLEIREVEILKEAASLALAVRLGKVEEVRTRFEELRSGPEGKLSREVAKAIAALEPEVAFRSAVAELERSARAGDLAGFDRRLEVLMAFKYREDWKELVGPAHLLLAETVLARGDAKGAETFLERALKRTLPEEWQLRELRGLARREGDQPLGAKADWEAALEILDGVMKGQPPSPDRLLGRARLQRRLGRLEEALRDAERAVSLRADGLTLFEAGALGYLRAIHGDPARRDERLRSAVERLDAAAKPGPPSAQVLAWRGFCRSAMAGRNLKGRAADEALEDLQAALADGALHPAARYKLAIILDDRAQPEPPAKEANAELLDRAIKTVAPLLERPPPLEEWEHALLGFEHDELSKTQGLQRLQRDTAILRATVHSAKKDFDRSIEDCDRAIILDPESSLAWLWKGVTHHNRKELGEAAAAYRKVLDLKSTPKEQGKAREGIEEIEKLRKSK